MLITWVISATRCMTRRPGPRVGPLDDDESTGGAMPVEYAAAPLVLMSMAEIADLAQVQRPVVTTWRRRHPDFPKPAGGDPSGWLFDPSQVADWLRVRGTIDSQRADQELALYTLAGMADQYRGPDFITAVTSLICLRYLSDENEPLSDASIRDSAVRADPADEFLLSEIRAIPRTAAWLVPLVDDFVEAAWDCQHAFERIMTARNRFKAGALSAAAVTPELARLIAEVSGAAELARRTGSMIVADPAAGSGDLLMAVAGVLGPDRPPLIAAAEREPTLARTLRRRLAVHGVAPEDTDVSIGAAFPDALGNPDVVVTQLGYQPGEERDLVAVLDAVDDVALQLAPGRFGVILGPAAALTDDLAPYSPAERTRAKLLTGDMVEAIVRLPGGVIPFMPGYETALWVLTQARDSRWRGRVLIADVSDRPLTAAVVTDLVEDIVTWRREGYAPSAHQRVFGMQVEVGQLVDPPRSLLPGRRPASERERKADADTRVNRVTQCGADLDRLGAVASADRRHVPTEMLAAADRRPVSETVGTLTRNRRLSIKQGIRIQAGDLHPSGKHPLLGPEEILGHSRPGERRVDAAVFVDRHPNARLTEPGDVLVTLSPRPGAMVDHAGYAIAEYPVRILRIPRAEAEQFTPRVLAALLFGDGSAGRPAGAVRASRDLGEQRIPLLPPDHVKRLDELLASIEARGDLARRELDLLDELRQVTTHGLIDGTLTLAQ